MLAPCLPYTQSRRVSVWVRCPDGLVAQACQPVRNVFGKRVFAAAIRDGEHRHRQRVTGQSLPERIQRGVAQCLAQIILADHRTIVVQQILLQDFGQRADVFVTLCHAASVTIAPRVAQKETEGLRVTLNCTAMSRMSR